MSAVVRDPHDPWSDGPGQEVAAVDERLGPRAVLGSGTWENHCSGRPACGLDGGLPGGGVLVHVEAEGCRPEPGQRGHARRVKGHGLEDATHEGRLAARPLPGRLDSRYGTDLR